LEELPESQEAAVAQADSVTDTQVSPSQEMAVVQADSVTDAQVSPSQETAVVPVEASGESQAGLKAIILATHECMFGLLKKKKIQSRPKRLHYQFKKEAPVMYFRMNSKGKATV
jgi:hypothetical protein